MTPFSVPEQYREGFELFVSLGEKRPELIKVFSDVKTGVFPETLSKIVGEKLSLPKAEASAIVDSITSMFGLYVSRIDESEAEFAEVFVEALGEFTKVDDSRALSGQLFKLLKESTNYLLSVKALNLVYERERIFSSVKILSDIRPVFQKDVHQFNTVVLLHTLEIQYREEKRRKSDFFALDRNDLIEFQKQISRALEKDKVITAKLAALFDVIDLNSDN